MELYIDFLSAEGQFAITDQPIKIKKNLSLVPQLQERIDTLKKNGNKYPSFVTALGRWIFVYMSDKETAAMYFIDVHFDLAEMEIEKSFSKEILTNIRLVKEKYLTVYNDSMDEAQLTLKNLA
tara:strand:+ start:2112 stop:2480 length:369 start_codon:yes stop_codon:yes gene_type:complete